MAKDIADKPRARTDTIDVGPLTATFGSMPAFLKWFALTLGVLLLLAVVGLGLVNRELPALIEGQLNAHVVGVPVYGGLTCPGKFGPG